jgi:hypothetical protein
MNSVDLRARAAGLVEKHAARLGMDEMAAATLVSAILALDAAEPVRPSRTTDRLDHPTGWPRAATPTDLRPIWIGEFCDFNDWVNFATNRLAGCRDPHVGGAVQLVCIDALGRRCTMGAHFMRARDEGAFPVRYFWECE